MTPEELYQKGLDAYDEDEKTAFDCFRQAAKQGHTGAQRELGFCYWQGDGVSEDSFEAAKWFRKAAEKGDREAQHELALFLKIYHYYDSCAIREAFGWYKKAADQGCLESAYEVAKMYKNGNGTEQNYEKAKEYFKKVAYSKDDPFDYPIEDSMREIGWLYYYGQGVEKDEHKALVWFKKSVEQIRHYPKRKEWFEKVESFVSKPGDMTVWDHLKKFIDEKGNIIK